MLGQGFQVVLADVPSDARNAEVQHRGAHVVRRVGQRVETKRPHEGATRLSASVLVVNAAELEVKLPRRLVKLAKEVCGGSQTHQGLFHHPAHEVEVVSAVPPAHVLGHELAEASVTPAAKLIEVRNGSNACCLADDDGYHARRRVVAREHGVVHPELHARRLVLKHVNALLRPGQASAQAQVTVHITRVGPLNKGTICCSKHNLQLLLFLIPFLGVYHKRHVVDNNHSFFLLFLLSLILSFRLTFFPSLG
mmetsp:Transcript_4802/g.13857  ORF Transcript_4802/g.13857 Transcript_4802/m.13857 type:complete len:251 (-) Transcript_4802:215-967(-)